MGEPMEKPMMRLNRALMLLCAATLSGGGSIACGADVSLGDAPDDGGAGGTTTPAVVSWTTQYGGTAHHIDDVHFIDEVTGWAASNLGGILATTDGGANWTTQYGETSHYFFTGVFFLDAMTGWAACNIGVYKTTDGGVTWTLHNEGLFDLANNVHFVDAAIGWAWGRTVYRTTDGGVTWSSQGQDFNYAAYFIDEVTGWAVGDDGTILKAGPEGD